LNFGPELVHIWALIIQQHTPVFIDRVEGGREWIALKFSKSSSWLFLSWGSRNNGCGIIDSGNMKNILELTEGQNSILLFMKKRVLKSRLIGAKQIGSDRILYLSFSKTLGAGFTSEIDIILELTGSKANLVMLDNDNIIREAAKHIHPEVNRYRTILPGVPYTPPPPFEGLDPEDVIPEDLETSMPHLRGIGMSLGKIILGSWCNHSQTQWLEMLHDTLRTLSAESVNFMKCGKYFTVFPECLNGCEIIDGDILTSSGKILADSMVQGARSSTLKQTFGTLEIMVKRKRKHLEGLEKQLAKSQNAEFYRTAGELLMSNAFRLKNGLEKVTLSTWEDNEKMVEIPLDASLGIKENAKKYFKKYRKNNLKDRKALIGKITALQSSIEELESQKDLLDTIDDLHVLKKVAEDINSWLNTGKKRGKTSGKYIPPFIKVETGGYQILVGMNAKGNRYVTFQIAGPDDIWFHVHEVPGSHVIAKRIGVSDLESEKLAFEIAASLAAYYSKAHNALKIQVDYTEKKNVRHIPGSGIAHVTYSHPRTLLISPEFWKAHL